MITVTQLKNIIDKYECTSCNICPSIELPCITDKKYNYLWQDNFQAFVGKILFKLEPFSFMKDFDFYATISFSSVFNKSGNSTKIILYFDSLNQKGKQFRDFQNLTKEQVLEIERKIESFKNDLGIFKLNIEKNIDLFETQEIIKKNKLHYTFHFTETIYSEDYFDIDMLRFFILKSFDIFSKNIDFKNIDFNEYFKNISTKTLINTEFHDIWDCIEISNDKEDFRETFELNFLK